jgi:hypothetical protein
VLDCQLRSEQGLWTECNVTVASWQHGGTSVRPWPRLRAYMHDSYSHRQSQRSSDWPQAVLLLDRAVGGRVVRAQLFHLLDLVPAQHANTASSPAVMLMCEPQRRAVQTSCLSEKGVSSKSGTLLKFMGSVQPAAAWRPCATSYKSESLHVGMRTCWPLSQAH